VETDVYQNNWIRSLSTVVEMGPGGKMER